MNLDELPLLLRFVFFAEPPSGLTLRRPRPREREQLHRHEGLVLPGWELCLLGACNPQGNPAEGDTAGVWAGLGGGREAA